MRELIALFAMLLMFFSCAGSSNKLKIIVLNEAKLPLHDAHIWHNGAIIGHTERNGSYWIKAPAADTLVVHYLGYKKYPVVMSSFKDGDSLVVQLLTETIALHEILVVNTNYQKVLKNAQEDFGKKYHHSLWACYGEYVRTTKQNNAYVDFDQRIGYTIFIGAKNAKDYVMGGSCFVPEQSRSSYFFENQEGYRQLDQSFDSKFTYNANTKSLTEHYRNVERYGPQNFSMAHYYNYSLSTIDDSLLVVNFSTNRKHIPKKIKMDCRGKMSIDPRNTRIVKIEFEQIHIRQNEKLVKLTKFPLRYITTFDVSYAYDNMHAFPATMQFSRHWLSDDRGNLLSDGFSPRPFPGKSHIVEYEYFKSQKCQVNEKAFNNELAKLLFNLSLMSINEKFDYDAEFWNRRSITMVSNPEEIFSDLSQIHPISDQFQSLNGQFKNDSSYVYSYICPEYHELFYKAWENVNSILKKFNSYDYKDVP